MKAMMSAEHGDDARGRCGREPSVDRALRRRGAPSRRATVPALSRRPISPGVLLPAHLSRLRRPRRAPCARVRVGAASGAGARRRRPGSTCAPRSLAYDGPARELVARLKYRNHRTALDGMAAAMAASVADRARRRHVGADDRRPSPRPRLRPRRAAGPRRRPPPRPAVPAASCARGRRSAPDRPAAGRAPVGPAARGRAPPSGGRVLARRRRRHQRRDGVAAAAGALRRAGAARSRSSLRPEHRRRTRLKTHHGA